MFSAYGPGCAYGGWALLVFVPGFVIIGLLTLVVRAVRRRSAAGVGLRVGFIVGLFVIAGMAPLIGVPLLLGSFALWAVRHRKLHEEAEGP